MQRIIHFFELAFIVVHLAVKNEDARRAMFNSIKPVL